MKFSFPLLHFCSCLLDYFGLLTCWTSRINTFSWECLTHRLAASFSEMLYRSSLFLHKNRTNLAIFNPLLSGGGCKYLCPKVKWNANPKLKQGKRWKLNSMHPNRIDKSKNRRHVRSETILYSCFDSTPLGRISLTVIAQNSFPLSEDNISPHPWV